MRRRRQRGRHVRPRDRRGWRASTCPRADGPPVRDDPPAAADPHRLPTMRDPDRLVYFREEVGGLVVGGYERDPDPWSLARHARPTSTTRCWRRTGIDFFPSREAATTLVPVLWPTPTWRSSSTDPRRSRPTASSSWVESEVKGFFVAAGFCAHGIAGAGGNGKVMAEWIVGGEPPVDLWKMDIRRFGDQYRSRGYSARPHLRGVQHLLRHRVSEPRARPAARSRHRPPTTAISGSGPRWARSRMGAGELVLQQRRPGARGHLRPRGWARRELVDGDRHRAPGDAGHGRPVRRIELRQDRGEWIGRRRLPATDVRQRRRPESRLGHLHLDAEFHGWHRMRLHRHAPCPRPLPDRHRHRVRPP